MPLAPVQRLDPHVQAHNDERAEINRIATALAEIDVTGYMPKTGGTFEGPVSVAGAPSANAHLTNKQYVDATRSVSQGGTGRTTGTAANSLIITGTTPVGAQQTIAGVTGTDRFLRSNGPGAAPSYEALPAATVPASFETRVSDLETGIGFKADTVAVNDLASQISQRATIEYVNSKMLYGGTKFKTTPFQVKDLTVDAAGFLDAELDIPIAANQILVLQYHLNVNGDVTDDFKVRLVAPALCTCSGSFSSAGVAVAATLGTARNEYTLSGLVSNQVAMVGASLGTGVPSNMKGDVVFKNGANAGLLQVRFARNTNGSGAAGAGVFATLQDDSYIHVGQVVVL